MQHRKNFLLLFLCLLYLVGFIVLERNINNFHIIHTRVDDAIPFVAEFIIPYLAWFLYIPSVGTYLYHTDTDLFYDFAEMLVTGMLLSLLICRVFPNGTDMRPMEFAINWFIIYIQLTQARTFFQAFMYTIL